MIESHGPTYDGAHHIEQWFKLWSDAKSKVLTWGILSFIFCEKEQVAFCEWDFSCISNNVQYSLPGMSVIKYKDDRITFIHEYRMTHPAYEWQGDELKSE